LGITLLNLELEYRAKKELNPGEWNLRRYVEEPS